MAMRPRRSLALWLVAAFLAITPIPLGSNRALFWGVNGALLGGLGFAYLLLTRGSSRDILPLRQIRVPALLMVAAIVWIICQILPVGVIFPALTAWAAGVQTTTISIDPPQTLWMSIRFLSYCMIFILVWSLSLNIFYAKRFLIMIFIIISAHATYSIISLLLLSDRPFIFLPKWSYLGYATGFFVNRNSFASFLGFGWIIGTVLLLDAYSFFRSSAGRKNGSPKKLGGLAPALILATGLLMIGVALLLTGSRMGAASALVGQLVVFLSALYLSKDNRLLFALPVYLLFILTLIVIYGESLLSRFESLDVNLSDRLLLYRQVREMIASRPWTGFGGGTFAEAFPAFHRLPLNADVTWDAAHNLYLELYCDLGIFSALPILAVIFLLVKIATSAAEAPTFAISCLGIAVSASVHSLVDFPLQIEANVFYFVSIFAIATAQTAARTGNLADDRAFSRRPLNDLYSDGGAGSAGWK